MEKILHRANTRGQAQHGWLTSSHTFSFGGYHNPNRMGFGKLRVLNDDYVAPAKGFGTHPHKDMEIVSIPLSGALKHEDNMGNKHIIRAGEVQVMSAGTGVTHSEFNQSDTEDVNFLQIWILPKKLGIKPRYEQAEFDPAQRQNTFQTVVSPDGKDGALPINQDAYFSLANIEAGGAALYTPQSPDNGVYVFVISGQAEIKPENGDGEYLEARDALGFWQSGPVNVEAIEDAEILCIEVPAP